MPDCLAVLRTLSMCRQVLHSNHEGIAAHSTWYELCGDFEEEDEEDEEDRRGVPLASEQRRWRSDHAIERLSTGKLRRPSIPCHYSMSGKPLYLRNFKLKKGVRTVVLYVQCRAKVSVILPKFRVFATWSFIISHLQFLVQAMPRTSLASISVNHTSLHELSSYQRGLVVEAASVEASVAKISETTNVSWFIVKDIILHASIRNNGVSKSRFDRSKLLSTRDERHLIRIARLQSKISYRELIEKADVECHRKIVYRLLKEYDLINWLTKKRSLLTPEVAAKRYAWCWNRRDWTYDEWKLFIFSDECSVERGTGKRRQWMFRTSAEKWNKEMIQSYKKEHDVSVMIWAAIHDEDRSELIRLSRDFEAKKKGYSVNSYIEILNKHLLKIYRLYMTFQQDNALIHTAKKMKTWFENKDVKTTNWSSYSSDLNCIEHIWFKLKEKVYQVNSNIESIDGGVDRVTNALWNVLKQAWPAIDEELIDRLIRSMTERVQAVIAAKGWYTRF